MPIHKNGGIDWEKCLGKEIYFQYDDIYDYFNVVRYVKHKGIECEYDNKTYYLSLSGIRSGGVGRLFKKTIAEKRPDLLDYFKYKNEAYLYTCGSDHEIIANCKCGYEKKIRINTLVNQGFSCPCCSDGISYCQKFVANLLKEIGVDFIVEYMPEWANGRRYDFYFTYKNIKYIIETHGAQHYIESFSRAGGKLLREEQANDEYKKRKAFENGYNENTYIIINCFYQNFEWIYKNIIKSNMVKILDFEDLDWELINYRANKSIVFDVCEIYNSNNYCSATELHKNYYQELSLSTICRYLKKGNELGLCSYNGKENSKIGYKNLSKRKTRKVLQFDKNNKLIKEWDTIEEVEKILNISHQNISNCCKGKRKEAGGFIWKYADEFAVSLEG